MVATLDLSNGFRVVREDDESARLRVEQRLRFILGEWPLNRNEGVNYWGFVGQPSDTGQIGRYLASEAARVQDVLDVTIDRVTLNNDGSLTAEFTIRTVSNRTVTVLTTVGVPASARGT